MSMSQNSGPKPPKPPKITLSLWGAMSYIASFNLYRRKPVTEEALSSLDLIQQWDQARDLFIQNFKALKNSNNFLKNCITRVNHNGHFLNVLDVLMRSPDQQAALPFIIDIIRAKVQEYESMEMDLEKLLLAFIRIAVERHNSVLANQLLWEWPNTDINRVHLRDGNTLLMHFIEKGSTREIEILLNLKSLNGQYCVNPNGPLSPLKRAQDLQKTQIVALLKQYGAQDHDCENEQKIRFEEAPLRSAQQDGLVAQTVVYKEWEGPADCIDDEFEDSQAEEGQGLLHRNRAKTS